MNGGSNESLDSRSLLSILKGGRDNNDTNKRSCRDLLRSKTVPCSQVLEVISNKRLSAQVLVDAHHVLLEEYTTLTATTNPIATTTPCSQEGNLSSSSSPSSTKSSLYRMNQLMVVIRFIQLLLLREPLIERNNHPLPAEQRQQLVSVLLQSTCQGLCTFIRSFSATDKTQPDDENDGNDEQQHENEESPSEQQHDDFDPRRIDASTTSDPRPVIVFAIEWLLRINHHYAKTRVALVAPLWKGICNVLVATCSLRHKLPQKSLEDAIKALSTYLIEGWDILTSPDNNNNNGEPIATETNTSMKPTPSSLDNGFSTLHVKLLQFFLRRTSTLLKLVSQPEDSEVVQLVYQLFAGFRGMAPVFQLRQQQLNDRHRPLGVYFEIGTKIQKLVTALCLSHTSCWIAFLQKDGGCNDHNNGRVNERSQSIGRALLLQWILKEAMRSPNCQSFTDPMLRTCEYLLSQVLPKCYGTLELTQLFQHSNNRQSTTTNPMICTLLHTSLQVMYNVVVRIDQNENFLQGHRLLCRWMDQMHPLAREMSISLVCLYWMETKSVAFLSLLAKLLFDCRTKRVLRTTLSAVLIRILCRDPDSQAAVEQLVEKEFLRLLKSTSRTRKKRRRSTSTSGDWGHYSADDVQAISDTLQHCRIVSDSLVSIMQSFCEKISSPTNGSGIILASAKRIALQCALLHGWLGRYREQEQHKLAVVEEAFHNTFGIYLCHFLQSYLRSISNESLTSKEHSSAVALAENKAILTLSMLRLCSRVYGCCKENGAVIPTNQISHLLKLCTDTSTSVRSSTLLSTEPKCQRMIFFEAVFVLRSFGKSIPASCPDSTLKVELCFCSLYRLFVDPWIVSNSQLFCFLSGYPAYVFSIAFVQFLANPVIFSFCLDYLCEYCALVPSCNVAALFAEKVPSVLPISSSRIGLEARTKER